MTCIRFLVLGLAGLLPLGGQQAPAEATPPPAAVAAGEVSKAAPSGFQFREFKLSNEKKAGASADYVESFKQSLAKRLVERKDAEGLPTGKLEIRFDKVVVVGSFKRGMLGVLAPSDSFAATLRVLDDKDRELAVITIPETKVMASTVGTNWDKMLGIEGAGLVFKTLFPEKKQAP